MTTAQRRAVYGALALVTVGIGTLFVASRGYPSGPARIVLIVIDTLRRDHLSCYGAAVATPRIDQLATTGHRYDNAVSSFHQTSMSMAALFTGYTPSLEAGDVQQPLPWNGRTWCGLARFARPGDPCIPPRIATLATILGAAGYHTIGVVSNPLLFKPAGYEQGFDVWKEVGTSHEPTTLRARQRMVRGRAASRVNAAVLAALDHRPGDRFFLYVHYMDVHDYGGNGLSYAQSVPVVDSAVGRLIDALRERKLLDGSVVVLTADHGERLGLLRHPLQGFDRHMGNPSFETVLDVPLIVWPRSVNAMKGNLIRTVDVFDEIAGLAGSRVGHKRALAPGELLLTEFYYLTYREGRWKSFLRRDDGTLFLFDLSQDPHEQHDIAQAHPEIAHAQETRMQHLAGALAASPRPRGTLSVEDAARLRALGYLN